MRRFTIMGFTEAELGFVVAALFAAVAVATLNERDAQAGDLRQQLDQLRAELKSVKEDLRKKTDELAQVKMERDQLRRKVSTKMPQCWEKGEPREAIADVVVLGEDAYSLEGQVVTLDQIRERFSEQIAHGRSLECHYVVRARPSANVNAVAQSIAVWRLRRYFDVDDRNS